MKKVFASVFAIALMVCASALNAQEDAATLGAQAVETVEAIAVDASPAEEVAPAEVDSQESVSDGVALEPTGAPMISVASDVFPGAVVLGGEVPAYGQPVAQAFAPSSCCSPCCGQVAPVVFNQPVVVQTDAPEVAASVVTPAPVPAAPVYSQPVTSGCSSCSGGGVVNYAPTATSYVPTPVATSYESAPVTSYAAPVESSYVAAPVESAGCNTCQAAAVSYAPSYNTNACCQPSKGLMSRGNSSRLRRALLGRLIRDNN